jgi:hypothetical protein
MTNRLCARITICLLIAVAVLTLAPTVSFAAVLPPNPPNPPYGKTYAEWSVLWWQWFLALTRAQVRACTIGQSDNNVSFLFAGPSKCSGTITSTTSLFFPVANVECSNLEAPPFFGATLADRDGCAFNFFTQLSTGTVTLDGESLLNLLPNYPTKSPDFTFVVGNANNVFGIKCNSSSCTGQSTGYGYYLMLAPLQSGTHTIHIKASDYGVDTIWTLTVQ